MDTLKETVKRLSETGDRLLVGGVPEGFDALLLAALATEGGDVLMLSRDDVSMARKAEALSFFAPGLEKLEFPAWDCLPYDRVSPRPELVSRRIDTLTRMLRPPKKGQGRVILTTVSALLQRIPPKEAFTDAVMTLKAGQRLDPADLSGFLSTHGYFRANTVVEPGEYAPRGGIVDVFPPGAAAPLRPPGRCC